MANQRYKLEVYVKKVYPKCAIYKEGDKMVFVEPALIPQDTDAICFSAMADILPYSRALCRGIPPENMGLQVEAGEAIFECPHHPREEGGVKFAVKRTPVTEEDRKKAFRVHTLEEISHGHEE